MRHRESVALVASIVGAFLVLVFADGSVIYPHDNSRELFAAPLDAPERLSNRKFSDLSSTVIPELNVQLGGSHDAWIATWNPHVELGRPTIHHHGLSKAFFATHALSFLSRDPLVVYSMLVALAVSLTALFGYLFLMSQRLSPLGCLTGALALSMGTWLSYWATFVMFQWGVCFGVGLLWALARFIERATALRAVLLVITAHALCLAAYPQQALWALYAAGGFTVIRLWLRDDDFAAKGRTVAQLIGLAVVTGASALPVLADVALDAARSTRRDFPIEYYLASLPSLTDWREITTFATRCLDAFWFGNPVSRDYPQPFDGQSLGTPLAALVAASAVPSIARRVWGWQLLCALCLALSIWPDAYQFAVNYLGLSISRWRPLSSAYVPLAILAAYTVDGLSSASSRERTKALALANIPLLLAVPGLAVASEELQGVAVVGGLALFVCTAAFILTGRAWLLVAALAVGGLHYGQRVVLHRTPDEIVRSSELVETLARSTPGNARYAKVRSYSIPPNQESMFGLRSVHSYNSLAPEAYAHWMERISAGSPQMAGRSFPTLLSFDQLDANALARAGVATLISTESPPSHLAKPSARVGRLQILRTVQSPLLEAQFGRWESRASPDGVSASVPPSSTSLRVERVVDLADRLVLDTTPSDQTTLLFVSQQYHPHWRAFRGGEELETIVVDDLFQGVLLPPSTAQIELRFLPWVRWSWIPQIALLASLGGCWWVGRTRRTGEG